MPLRLQLLSSCSDAHNRERSPTLSPVTIIKQLKLLSTPQGFQWFPIKSFRVVVMIKSLVKSFVCCHSPSLDWHYARSRSERFAFPSLSTGLSLIETVNISTKTLPTVPYNTGVCNNSGTIVPLLMYSICYYISGYPTWLVPHQSS